MPAAAALEAQAPAANTAALTPTAAVRPEDRDLKREEIQRRVDELFAQLGINHEDGLDFHQYVLLSLLQHLLI